MNSKYHSSAVSRRKFLGQIAAGAAAWSLAPRVRAQAEPRKLGVALVGLGGYATGQLLPALKLTQHCRLAGVVTGSPEKGRTWAREHGFPESSVYGYETMARMAGNPDIDIVYVVTPNALHARDVMAAARAGKHVISEKPFTTTVAEAEAALKVVRAAGVRHSMGYRLHFDPYHQELIRLARDRDFGAFTRMNGGFSFMMRRKVWRAEHALAGGGPVMDLGVYVIQSACMAAGGMAPVAVTAKEGPKTRPDIFEDVEETMHWTMEFAGGATCEATTSYQGSVNQFRAEAADGWIEIGPPAYSYRGLTGRTSRAGLSFEPPVNQQARQMDDFALCIRENRATRVPLEMGLRDMKIIEAIYEAARTGRRTMVTA